MLVCIGASVTTVSVAGNITSVVVDGELEN